MNGVPGTFYHQLEWVSHLSMLAESLFQMGFSHLSAEGEVQHCTVLDHFGRVFYRPPQTSSSTSEHSSSQHIVLVQKRQLKKKDDKKIFK